MRNEDERPLTARSVLASTLLGTDPPELPVRRLVAVARLFGVSDNSARVALSRMAAAGEVEAVDGRYRLAGHLLERQARLLESRAPRLHPWDGSWWLVALPTDARPAAERIARRRALGGSRLAEFREGLWLRPANLALTLPPDVEQAATRFRAIPDGDPAALAAGLWDLGGWAAVARRLADRLAALAPALAAGDTTALAPGFVLSANVLRHLVADPVLPAGLQPPAWPAGALRAQYDAWDSQYRSLLADYQRSLD
jgi:phenylacetic acid degradation operon negative regulatory protein